MRSVDEVGQLHNSHIIPRFILLKSKEKGRAIYFEKRREKPFLSQADWKERMLCALCEHKLKVLYEDYINETFFLHRRNPILFDDPERIYFSANNDQLALAFLSIFWRAAVSTLPEFKFVLLPDYIRNELRKWIFNATMPPDWRNLVSITLDQLIDDNGNIISLVTSPFIRDKSTEGHFEFIFIFGGYSVIFSVPPPKINRSKRRSLNPQSQIVRITKIHYEAVPELKKLLSQMIETEKRN